MFRSRRHLVRAEKQGLVFIERVYLDSSTTEMIERVYSPQRRCFCPSLDGPFGFLFPHELFAE